MLPLISTVPGEPSIDTPAPPLMLRTISTTSSRAIDTGGSLAQTQAQVDAILACLGLATGV